MSRNNEHWEGRKQGWVRRTKKWGKEGQESETSFSTWEIGTGGNSQQVFITSESETLTRGGNNTRFNNRSRLLRPIKTESHRLFSGLCLSGFGACFLVCLRIRWPSLFKISAFLPWCLAWNFTAEWIRWPCSATLWRKEYSLTHDAHLLGLHPAWQMSTDQESKTFDCFSESSV